MSSKTMNFVSACVKCQADLGQAKIDVSMLSTSWQASHDTKTLSAVKAVFDTMQARSTNITARSVMLHTKDSCPSQGTFSTS